MGVERFVQAILKLPFIWETKPFPRVDGQIRP
jgi:aspartyl/asparaginyl-tRNA synthetase